MCPNVTIGEVDDVGDRRFSPGEKSINFCWWNWVVR